jgi:hypothetical protein
MSTFTHDASRFNGSCRQEPNHLVAQTHKRRQSLQALRRRSVSPRAADTLNYQFSAQFFGSQLDIKGEAFASFFSYFRRILCKRTA